MKKNKIVVFFMVILSIALIPNTTYADRIFNDVNEDNPYYTEVKYLYDLGIVDNEFSVFYGIEGSAARKDVIVMLGKALGLDGTKRKTSFKDVPMDYYASGYIQSAVDAGIIKGYTDGTFRPNGELNRGHLSTFIERAFRNDLPNGSDIEFDDVGPNHTSYESVKKMAAAGITTGYPDGTFKPHINLSKKHLTTFMYRTMQFLDKEVTEKEYTSIELQNYLRKNYTTLQTKIFKVNFDIKVSENDSRMEHYDYYVELGFDSADFEQAMNAHLRSIKNAATAESDVAISRKQLNDFLEEMAIDILQKSPDKKILGQNYKGGYRYPNLQLGRYYTKDYSWTNYEPIQMKNQWPGNQPDDYWDVMFALKDPSDPKVIKYSNDESSRDYYIWEYTTLKYDDFKITQFDWHAYLDAVYYDPKYY